MPLPPSLRPIPFPDHEERPGSPRMEFHMRKERLAGTLLLAIPLLFVSWYCTRQPGLKAQVAGWLGLVVFSFFSVYGLFQLFAKGPVIVLSEEGIYDRRFGMGVLPWNQISAIWEKSMRGHRFLCIEVHDEKILKKMSFIGTFSSVANELLGYGKLTLNFVPLDGDIDDALRFISRHLQLLRPPP